MHTRAAVATVDFVTVANGQRGCIAEQKIMTEIKGKISQLGANRGRIIVLCNLYPDLSKLVLDERGLDLFQLFKSPFDKMTILSCNLVIRVTFLRFLCSFLRYVNSYLKCLACWCNYGGEVNKWTVQEELLRYTIYRYVLEFRTRSHNFGFAANIGVSRSFAGDGCGYWKVSLVLFVIVCALLIAKKECVMRVCPRCHCDPVVSHTSFAAVGSRANPHPSLNYLPPFLVSF